MFEREHHVRVASVLGALDGDLLESLGCLFGGGTAIVLRFGEYRESHDIDFLVSDRDGYRELRRRLIPPSGLQSILRPGARLELVREVRADQYGIRTMVRVGPTTIKLEIVSEGRFELEPPSPNDRVGGVASLTILDMATSKLLANADRWADDAVLSRDLIDLAMIGPRPRLLRHALSKAGKAYPNVDGDLARAIDRLAERAGRLDECRRQLAMTLPLAVLWKRIKALRGGKK